MQEVLAAQGVQWLALACASAHGRPLTASVRASSSAPSSWAPSRLEPKDSTGWYGLMSNLELHRATAPVLGPPSTEHSRSIHHINTTDVHRAGSLYLVCRTTCRGNSCQPAWSTKSSRHNVSPMGFGPGRRALANHGFLQTNLGPNGVDFALRKPEAWIHVCIQQRSQDLWAEHPAWPGGHLPLLTALQANLPDSAFAGPQPASHGGRTVGLDARHKYTRDGPQSLQRGCQVFFLPQRLKSLNSVTLRGSESVQRAHPLLKNAHGMLPPLAA